ncbi:hypothetical protein [Amycolatopsis sp. CA-128772]|uniref:hypothetical protein n=1 Tax=Amycolatopsis sp. CA-128772 TaxID=2073159 RepID=UPI001E3D7061|nr:hypothetical protein [Amycolatopsis sp. CA-128772]
MEKVRFTEEKATKLATLYGRALDYRSAHPILGDKAARTSAVRPALIVAKAPRWS